MDTTPSTSQVQVKFVTHEAEIAVNPAPILVPSNLKRFGLSQVVNHLLSPTSPIPFDFVIDGSFLRTSLDSYIADNGLTSESIITLEYVRAAVPPKYLSSFEHDDWVSSVSVRPGSEPLILSGAYDGIARVWNLSGEVIGQAAGHTAGIKSSRWTDTNSFVTAGLDRSLRTWTYTPDDAEAIQCVAEYVGHTSTVECIATNSSAQRILSGSADANIGVWSTSINELPPPPADTVPIRSKRRKVSKSTNAAKQYGALGYLRGHDSPVSGVMFTPQDSTVAYSVSWDHTIKTWDLTTLTQVDSRTTQHPLLSICALPQLSQLACGSSARHITLHDPRASASSVSTATLRGHTNAVVALSPSPDNQFQLVSASHDGTVRVWDVRAAHSGNLFTIQRQGRDPKIPATKVFDVEWNSCGIVSGGEDKKIQIDSMPAVEGEQEML
ncbi:WD40 repeat-like protein [Ascodesmis nigricans]|uniref:Ribosome biogenesis protein YTM1 n=1 Tax=Ascodesmis nigricans TaxID=341454 RepID=A0A4S2N4P8_9PEZI|nr:WD40 repeat-like protein [Ascodesmis nigricans]